MLYQTKSAYISKKDLKVKNIEISLEKKLEQLHPKKIDLSLERINNLLYKLGNPQKKIKNIIHIAGTNGKGSVLAFLKSFIQASGFTVNTYTSPHLINFNERINLNDQNISNEFLEVLLDMCNKKNDGKPITFFEITTAAAFLAFKIKPADFTILETGLGGRLDATNIIKKPIITIINEISIDHKNFLGSNIKQIAKEKAGIIKKNSPVVIGKQTKKAIEIIKKVAKNFNVKTFFYKKDWFIKKNEKKNHIIFFNNLKNNKKEKYPQPNLLGEHQIINAGIALKAFNLIMKKKFNKNFVKKGLKTVKWTGRLQKIYLNKELFSKKINHKKWKLWFDGGHNKSASKALAKTFKNWNVKKLYLIFGMLNSKNPKDFLNSFKKITTKLITVTIKSNSPYYPNKKLYEIAKLNEFNVETGQNIRHAIKKLLLNESPGQILICGSFYMYKEVSKLLKK